MRRARSALVFGLLLCLTSARVADALQISATYPVGQQPFGVVSDPIGGRIYVADSGVTTASGGGLISVVDPVSGNVTSLATTYPANLLAIDTAARRLYSSNATPSGSAFAIDVFDLTTGARIGGAPVGGLGIALDATRSRAYAATARVLSAMDTTTFATTTVFAPFGESWFGVATDPGLGRVFVTNIDNTHPTLAILDADTLAVVQDIALPDVPRFALAVDTTRHLVFVGGSDPAGPPFAGSRVFALDGATGAIVNSVPLPGFPSGIAQNTVTHRIYVTDGYNNTVAELDDTTLAITSGPVQLPWQPSLDVLGADGRLYLSGYSASVLGAMDARVDQSPVIDQIGLAPDPVRTNDVLAASVTAHDPDGDSVSLSYRWYRNGVALAATGPSLDLSVPGNGDKGDLIAVVVTASDGSREATASVSATVANSAPTANVTLDTTTPAKKVLVTATTTAADPDGDALTFTYTWTLNGATARAITTASTRDVFDLATVEAENGSVLTVTVLASDGSATGTASASATVTRPTH